jgi:preprotein translocase subunit SecE
VSGVRASPPVLIIKNMFKKIFKYCKESYDELVHKTTWPTRSELTNSAVVVLSASLLIALVVFAMDFVFQSAMEVIYPN